MVSLVHSTFITAINSSSFKANEEIWATVNWEYEIINVGYSRMEKRKV